MSIKKVFPSFVLLLTLLFAAPVHAQTQGDPFATGCGSGYRVAGNNVVYGGVYKGTLSIYKTCGNYFAYFKSGSGVHATGIQITNWNNKGYNSWRWWGNSYAGWTDMILGACVYAQVNLDGAWMGGVSYQCGW